MDINSRIVLRLNSHWAPIGVSTIKQAIVAMNSFNENDPDNPPAFGLDIYYEQLSSGEFDFNQTINIIPCKWDEWINLPIRPFERDENLIVHSAKLEIRAPIIIVATNYSKIPKHHQKLTARNVAKRDNYTCQYTGQKLTHSTFTMDHIIPKARGGKDTWTNIVSCHKEVNLKKGDKLNSEIGLQLLKEPKEPPVVMATALINEIKIKYWKPFIIK